MSTSGDKLQRDKINHKETRMVKDGEDWQGLQTTSLKYLGWTFQDTQNSDQARLSCQLIV